MPPDGRTIGSDRHATLVNTGRSELHCCLNPRQGRSQRESHVIEGLGKLQSGQIEGESSEVGHAFDPEGRPQESVVGCGPTLLID